MRVLQLIDSLEIGGAETVAVNYANALSGKIPFSGLVATRKAGPLKKNVGSNVVFACLDKKNSFDIKAHLRLRKFIIEHNVEIIHAHGTSYFTACIAHLLNPGLRLVWHEHYGARINQTRGANWVLLLCSLLFRHIFVVNLELKQWMRQKLWTKKVDYIPNFAMFPPHMEKETQLEGVAGKRIVCLANLKEPKNHLFLLQAFDAVKKRNKDFDWSLHLIGKDFQDAYSDVLKQYILQNRLQENVFVYGLKTDIENILGQAEIGVLASTNEGFPIALLEFALAGVPVISTNAGYCGSVVSDGRTGLLFDPAHQPELEAQFQKMISDTALRARFREALKGHRQDEFSEEKVIALLIANYSAL